LSLYLNILKNIENDKNKLMMNEEVTMLKRYHEVLNINSLSSPVSKLCSPDGLSEIEKTRLEMLISKRIQLKKGEHIYLENESLYNIYAVISGCCKEYVVDRDGNEKIFGFFFPGDIIAIESIHKKKYGCSCAALKDSTLCAISYEELFKLLHASPELLRRFILLLSQRTSHCRSLVSSTNAKRRLASFLMYLLRNSYGKEAPENQVHLPMSQLDIGNMLGMTHETVSRILKNFQSRQIIKIKNKNVYIHDKNLLQSMAV
jgi:CRP/FNR family transcriptional regulator